MTTEDKTIKAIEILLVGSILVYGIAYGMGSLYLAVYAGMVSFMLGIAGIVISLWKRRYILTIVNFLLVVSVFVHIMFLWNL